jgi:crotonobetainyl-CoA:carnitine CoA-transferase CaiB-like acyl-CoA transferase
MPDLWEPCEWHDHPEIPDRFVQAPNDDAIAIVDQISEIAVRVAVRGEVAQKRQNFVGSDGVPPVRLPWAVDGSVAPWQRPAPRLGEHTAEVFDEIGYSADTVRDLIECDAVATGSRPASRSAV